MEPELAFLSSYALISPPTRPRSPPEPGVANIFPGRVAPEAADRHRFVAGLVSANR